MIDVSPGFGQVHAIVGGVGLVVAALRRGVGDFNFFRRRLGHVDIAFAFGENHQGKPQVTCADSPVVWRLIECSDFERLTKGYYGFVQMLRAAFALAQRSSAFPRWSSLIAQSAGSLSREYPFNASL